MRRGIRGGVLVGLLAALGLSASTGVASAAAFAVTNTNDSGQGSLRQAILDANALPGKDQIHFSSLMGPGVQTIAVTSAVLPAVTDPLVIDGKSKPGYAGSPLVRLDNQTGKKITGLKLDAGASQVLGLEITRFAVGIRLTGDGNVVAGNLVGTDAAGAGGLGNDVGVRIAGGSGNTIGGTAAGARNVISGNTSIGVDVAGVGTTATKVAGNVIGTDPGGGVARPNGVGVRIGGGSTSNTVGGGSSAARNLISGNTTGIDVTDSGTSGNTVSGNYVGTTAAGTAALANTTGILIEAGAAQNTVGGSSAGARNLVSGNGTGVSIAAASGNTVAGNYVGTTPDGAGVLANAFGVRLTGGASGNVVGGTVAGARNLVSGNTTAGVDLAGSGTTSNTVAGNYLGTNAAATGALANAVGVKIEAGASGNTIGGTAAGSRNLISGNPIGVDVAGAATTGNTIEGNYVGTDPAGTAKLANGTGIRLEHATAGNTVGGTAAEARNLISGNGVGVQLTGSGGNVVDGNYVGTDPTGGSALGNGTGVLFEQASGGSTIGGTAAGAGNLISGNGVGVDLNGADSNAIAGNRIGTNAAGDAKVGNGTGLRLRHTNGITIGGAAAGAGNLISGNGGGILLLNFPSNTTIAGNSIGVDATGTVALGNGYAIEISVVGDFGGAGGITIGGTVPAARNVISGNGTGIELDAAETAGIFGTVIQGNYIGTNAAGDAAIGNGTGVGMFADCGDAQVSGSVVGGTTAAARNVIAGNQIGVELSGYYTGDSCNVDSNTVEGNYIGTNAKGTAALPNGTGVLLSGGVYRNTIGGTSAGARNLISGNGVGVDVSGAVTTQNTVAGNYVGTSPAGKGKIANGTGIRVEQDASANTIGGTAAGAGNLISGNTDAGVEIVGSVNGATVAGNSIGTNASGTGKLGNGVGVRLGPNADGSTVGGTTAAARNLISGNTGAGVEIVDSSQDTVAGNYVGTDVSGAAALPNGSGVSVSGDSNGHTIGGTAAGSGNVIAFNKGAGVTVDGSSATAIGILGNSLFSNAGLGISLLNGGNGGAAPPVVTSVTSGGGSTTIDGTLASTPSTQFRIELFSSTSCDPSGAGEGEQLLGSVDATTDAGGAATFSTSVSQLPPGQAVTATATGQALGSSQFSLCYTSP